MEKYLLDNNTYSNQNYKQNYKEDTIQFVPTDANNSLLNQLIKTLNLCYAKKKNKKQHNYLNSNWNLNIDNNSYSRKFSKYPKSSKKRKVNISM